MTILRTWRRADVPSDSHARRPFLPMSEWCLFDWPLTDGLSDLLPGLTALAMLAALFVAVAITIFVCTQPYHP